MLSSIDRAFALNPADRWQSAKEWLRALNAATDTEPEPVTVSSPPPLTVCQPQQPMPAPTKQQEARQRVKEQNITPDEYDNALIEATKEGQVEQVSLLITAGANVNNVDENGRTPLYWAARNDRTECMRLLIATPDIDVNSEDNNGYTPLDCAEKHGHSKSSELLIAAGACRTGLLDRFINFFS